MDQSWSSGRGGADQPMRHPQASSGHDPYASYPPPSSHDSPPGTSHHGTPSDQRRNDMNMMPGVDGDHHGYNVAAAAQSAAMSGSQFLQSTTREIKLYISANPSSERAICLAAGASLLFTSSLWILDIPLLWRSLPKYLVYCFLAVFGGVISLLNGMWALPTQELILKYCYFLHVKDGRAFIFCFLGTEEFHMLLCLLFFAGRGTLVSCMCWLPPNYVPASSC